MYHSSSSHPQPFFSEEDEDPSLTIAEQDPSPQPQLDDTQQRLQLLQEHLQEAHRLLDQQDKRSKEREKKLYKLQYLLQHDRLPPVEPRPASGLHGISVGTALQHLLKCQEQPLLALFRSTASTSLSTLTCPYEMDPREGYSRWTLSMLLADSLWTCRERDCIRQASQEPHNGELQKQAHFVLDLLDTWVVRATAALEGREYKGNRKPYIPGVGKILGQKQLQFREFMEPFQIKDWSNSEYQHTTPMREWIQQTEQAILQTKREEKERKLAEKASAAMRKRHEQMETFLKGSQATK